MSQDQSPIEEMAGKLKEKLWQDQIKSFLDFGSFLRQRRLVLQHPLGDFPPEALSSREWRTPLTFAIHASLLVGVIAGMVSKGCEKLVRPRPVTILQVVASPPNVDFVPQHVKGGATWETRKEILNKYRDITASELNRIQSNVSGEPIAPPVQYSEADNATLFIFSVTLIGTKSNPNISKKQAIPLYEAELSALDAQIADATREPYIESLLKSLRFVTVGIVMLLSAYLFRFLSGFRNGVGSDISNAHKHFLYAVPAHLFWPNFALSILLVVQTVHETYFPPGFDDIVNGIDAALRSIHHPTSPLNPATWSLRQWLDIALQAGALLIVVWSYVNVRNAARWLAASLSLPATVGSGFYRGIGKIRKDALIALVTTTMVVGGITLLASDGIARLAVWLSNHQI